MQEHLPWFTIVFGLLMAGAGAWLLAGRQLPALAPNLRRAPIVTRSLPSMALFGMAYATAPLGCAIAPFLAIVVSAFRSGSTGEGIALCATYAGGMGLIVGATSLSRVHREVAGHGAGVRAACRARTGRRPVSTVKIVCQGSRSSSWVLLRLS